MIESLQARVSSLEVEVVALRRQVGRDSSNSSQPPSQDDPGAKAKTKAGKRSDEQAGGPTSGSQAPKRAQGGQKGHRGTGLERVAFPDRTRTRDVQVNIGLALGIGLMGGVVGGLVLGFWVGLTAGVILGLGFALLIGLWVGLNGAGGAAPSLWAAEIALRPQGLRVGFMSLLEAALERQVLRQSGVVYQFRHAELQDRLAAGFSSGRYPRGHDRS